jgi:hypothetical protein
MIIKFSQLRITDNPNFKKWFGDSKVVDNSGQPLIMYHGTSFPGKIKKFKQGKAGELGAGIYFTPMKEAAYLFGKNIIPVYLSAEPYDISLFRKNPRRESLSLASKIIELNTTPETLKDMSIKELAKRIQSTWGEDSYRFWVEKAGFDALKDSQGQIPGQILVFNNTQIKSATQNTGVFDSLTEDIFK